MQIALADTGPLAAWFNADDPDHAIAKAFFQSYRGVLLSTWPVITEVTHLLRPAAQVKFLAWVRAGGARIEDLAPPGLEGIERLIAKYADLPMDFADASLVWLAETAGVGEVVTFDTRGFESYRYLGRRRFVNLLPDPRARRHRRRRAKPGPA